MTPKMTILTKNDQVRAGPGHFCLAPSHFRIRSKSLKNAKTLACNAGRKSVEDAFYGTGATKLGSLAAWTVYPSRTPG